MNRLCSLPTRGKLLVAVSLMPGFLVAGRQAFEESTEKIELTASRNLDSTREAEPAAHNLNELGQRLEALVGRYRL